ncbi:hypothetical protein FGG90_01390 [Clavibacter tessellarius]|uniref:Uncharacterized protein n=1 Tax=Clavibacter tessellarius TaxID=31965 RepID=A0A225C443_9MICO|nr:hypothetical protein [Clavibacter michiganensis]OQJ61538.1 hypothetical protein B5P24_00020 [Clavibacter michiganensis subsp. tessellarius]OQJ64271.1 hypothetical protein B5P24_15335 [Clavibacter michiganensis subsp. tessellarius]UKF32761.1 hypothetical protein FGG90_01390 [Clavibacter michiganensis subsp. tessellarius]
MPQRTRGRPIGRPIVLQRWLVVAGAVVALATLAGLMVPAEWRVLTAAVSALAVFAGVVLTWRKTLAEEALRARAASQEEVALRRARADRERSAILFGYNVSELLGTIDGLARRPASERSQEIAAVRQSAAVQCKEGVGAVDARAAYFRVEDLRATRRRMTPDKVASSPERTDGFTTVFEEGGDDDQDVWDVLDGRRTTSFVEDVAEWEAARAGRRGTRSYGTFITARVEAGGVAFGILTVNAVRPGSLLHEDKLYVAAMARILGLAELLCLTTHAHRTATDAAAGRSGMSGVVPMIGYRQEGAS